MADPAADLQNLIGLQGLMGDNPFTNPAWNHVPYPFGQSAAAGPLGQLPGMAQINTGVMGNAPPTDAYGVPIKGFVDYSNDQNALYAQQMKDYNAKLAAAPPPGTTLNSTPAGAGAGAGGPIAPTGYGPLDSLVQGVQQAQAGKQSTPYGIAGTNPYATAAAGGATPQQLAGMFSQMSPTIPYSEDSGVRGGTPAPPGVTNSNYANRIGALMAGIGPGQGGGGAAGGGIGPPPTPTNLSGAYMDALRNPGPIAPVGARPPQPGQTPTGSPPASPNVMQAFLANAGSTPFAKTLQGMGGTPA